MKIYCRKATTQDLPHLLPLLQSLFSLEEDFSFSADLQMRGLQMLLDSSQAIVLIALADDRVVGMVTGQLLISTAEGALSLLIEDLVIAEDMRNHGIGSTLLNRVSKWGQSHSAYRMQLLADRTNFAALHFYQHMGWQQTNLIAFRKYSKDTL